MKKTEDRLIKDLVRSPDVINDLLQELDLPSIIVNNEDLLQQLVATKEVTDAVIKNITANKILLTDTKNHHDNILALIKSDRFQQYLTENPELIQALLTKPELFSQILASNEIIDKLVSNKVIQDAVRSKANVMDIILSSPEFFSRIIENESLRKSIVTNPKSYADITADIEFMSNLLSNEKTLNILSQKNNIIDNLLDTDSVRSRIENHNSLKPFLLSLVEKNKDLRIALSSSDRIFSEILNNDETIKQLITNNKVIGQIAEEPNVLKRVLADQRCIEGGNYKFNEFSAKLDFIQYFQSLTTHLSNINTVNQVIANNIDSVYHPSDIKNIFMGNIVRDNCLTVGEHTIRFPDAASAWVLFNEIFYNEDYRFDAESESPVILDCGSHCGASIVYFKLCYPLATVIGFEPVPVLYDLIHQNINHNRLKNVTVHPYALSHKSEQLQFHMSETDSMAGTLTERRETLGDDVSLTNVEARCLSEFIQGPVDYLKLDIEGSEDSVLEECQEKLPMVKYLFCEYHHGAGLAPGRLSKILGLLETNHFEVSVRPAWSYLRKPFSIDDLGEPCSAVIFAKNTCWPPK